MGNCVQIAKAVIDQLGDIQPPIPIEEIAYGVDIDDIKELRTRGFEGALIADDAKSTGTILVNSNSIPERRRFTIGHELGHFLSPWHKPPDGGFKCSKEDMFRNDHGGNARRKMEVEANKFSAEILMPETLFCRDIQKRPSPGLEHILQWGDRYETSKIATVRRFVDLYGEPSAMVVTKLGVISQIHRHKSFPFIEPRYGQSVQPKAVTAKFTGDIDDCSDSSPTEPSFWISARLARGAEMYEQVLVQGKGYKITLLTIDETEAEDEDDEYERERSEWKPTYHR
ncbi:MAG TPA: ImmA/IrrE family metallo-endopeptidase [Woeseiaceae bacterium]|nr:ImmA/IrrE family metallo-endopeptidase [Woeseiaceae bacterium]